MLRFVRCGRKPGDPQQFPDTRKFLAGHFGGAIIRVFGFLEPIDAPPCNSTPGMLTHKALCALAVAWLQRPASRSGPGCTVAISETSNWINGEVPDAIGWRPYRQSRSGSVLVEVKVSRADFLADAKKPHRMSPADGMGAYRYFMAPEGILRLSDLPEKWGLVEVTSRGHLKVRAGHVLLGYHDEDTWRHDHNQFAETCTLAMCLNRVGDPQKLQDQLRERGNQNARLAKRNDELSKRNAELSRDLFLLRNAEAPTPATACAVY